MVLRGANDHKFLLQQTKDDISDRIRKFSIPPRSFCKNQWLIWFSNKCVWFFPRRSLRCHRKKDISPMQRVRKFCRAVDQPKMTPIKQLMQVVFYVQWVWHFLYSRHSILSSHPEDELCIWSFLQSKRTPHSVVLYPVVGT
jgi:hypothetical protein